MDTRQTYPCLVNERAGRVGSGRVGNRIQESSGAHLINISHVRLGRRYAVQTMDHLHLTVDGLPSMAQINQHCLFLSGSVGFCWFCLCGLDQVIGSSAVLMGPALQRLQRPSSACTISRSKQTDSQTYGHYPRVC